MSSVNMYRLYLFRNAGYHVDVYVTEKIYEHIFHACGWPVHPHTARSRDLLGRR
jgi:hypothetical protein